MTKWREISFLAIVVIWLSCEATCGGFGMSREYFLRHSHSLVSSHISASSGHQTNQPQLNLRTGSDCSGGSTNSYDVLPTETRDSSHPMTCCLLGLRGGSGSRGKLSPRISNTKNSVQHSSEKRVNSNKDRSSNYKGSGNRPTYSESNESEEYDSASSGDRSDDEISSQASPGRSARKACAPS